MALPGFLWTNQSDVGDLAIIEFRGLLNILSRHAVQRVRDIFRLGQARLPQANARQLDKAVIVLRLRSDSQHTHHLSILYGCDLHNYRLTHFVWSS